MSEDKQNKDWVKEIEISGHELVKKIKELVQQGNIRKLRIKNHNNEVLMEIPLNAGIAGAGAIAILSPVLAGIGALAVFLTKAKIEIVRVDDKNPSEDDSPKEE
ncbi:MAG: DUF4342 domain-containing protein [Spirochaetales bacterium]|nr:DUF4342 domain-containing protein [Spirochaetales bacterium]